MAFLLILVFFIAIPAAIAAGMAGILAIRQPGWSLRRRSVVAAAAAGLVPVILPIASILSGNDGGVGPVVPTVAVLVLALLMALLVGLPVALWIGRRKQAQPIRPDLFD